ncbi:MAG: HAD family hydrolase [Planctomycetes bacterium]|nr:HAD family hydrolase [Planctomycetota bacterium]
MGGAVFLDRDGVLMPDRGFVTDPADVELFPYAPEAVGRINALSFPVFVVTNQAIVARGDASEADIAAVNRRVEDMIAAGGGKITEFYFCPHHPNATLEEYRTACACRKPEPGMLLAAAKKYDINLNQSFMIGDRPSDMQAGKTAGCTTILVETGCEDDAPIISVNPLDERSSPDYRCRDLLAAVGLIEGLVEKRK